MRSGLLIQVAADGMTLMPPLSSCCKICLEGSWSCALLTAVQRHAELCVLDPVLEHAEAPLCLCVWHHVARIPDSGKGHP